MQNSILKILGTYDTRRWMEGECGERQLFIYLADNEMGLMELISLIGGEDSTASKECSGGICLQSPLGLYVSK